MRTRKFRQTDWLKDDVEEIATNYAVQKIIPAHLAEVKERKKILLDKIEIAVKERLTAEINYWDFRAGELRELESIGKTNAKQNAEQAAKRAEELATRLQKRMDEIKLERNISADAPIVVGGAIIVPKNFFSENISATADNRKIVEQKAMAAVMQIERELGNIPRDVSHLKLGYDIESRVAENLRGEGNCLRFIEVKGRRADADTVTVSKNEILTALNKPDQFILAIVEVAGDKTNTTYLQRPFKTSPDFGAVSVNYRIADLLEQGVRCKQISLNLKP